MHQVILYACVYAKQKINLTWPYCCIIHNISKSEAINLLKNSLLEDRGYIQTNIVLNFSLFKAVFSLLFWLV